MLRRSFITAATALAGVGVLAACGANQSLQTVSGQILADLQGLQAAAQSIVQVVVQFDPKAITADVQAKIDAGLSAVEQALTTLSTATPVSAGATALQTAEAAIQDVLNAIGSILPAASAQFPAIAKIVPVYDAALAIFPIVANYINSLLPAPKTAALRPVGIPIHQKFDPAAARALLHIPTVH